MDVFGQGAAGDGRSTGDLGKADSGFDSRLTVEDDVDGSVTHAVSGREVGSWKDRQRMIDPLVVADVEMLLTGVPLPEPGKYLFYLRCNGELIASRPFYVNAAKRSAKGS